MTNKYYKAAGYKPTALKKNIQGNYMANTTKNTQHFDRSSLPTPAEYYTQQFKNLRIKSEWVSVLCPFHDDHAPSLRISLTSGGFYCHACGAKGGDVLAFQMQRYNEGFKQAAITLGAWRWR